MGNMDLWNAMRSLPPEALRPITGGRLKGKTDINPQFRYQVMTEQFGPCGVGWKYEIVRVWNEPGPANQVFAFAEILLYIKQGEWSEPIPGVGGSMLVEQESSGLHASDEGYKMAITDALSVAMKMIGVAADVYAGLMDGSKYKQTPANQATSPPDASKRAVSDKGDTTTQTTEEMAAEIYKNRSKDKPIDWSRLAKTAAKMGVKDIAGIAKALNVKKLPDWTETGELALDAIEAYARLNSYTGPGWREL